ncbi:MAG: aminotransferase class I/II-fold pyridoxal phosphate-dependent enzyme [bacterium]|nr:aminotransferase class I/II-fold pyridoxal phosphate-dependent enzyme [bacterium]
MSRLQRLAPYLFTEIDRAKRVALAAGRDVIDLGIGDPDRPTPAPLLDAMAAAIRRPEHHRYPANRGSAALRQSAAAWLQRRHGVTVDPETQILALIGSKEGLAHLPLALLEEGDEVLVPDIGYPVYASATLLAGGVPRVFPLAADRGFLPDPAALAAAAGARTRLLFLNYPNNPTGATAAPGFYADVVAALRGTGVVIASDAAYLEVVPEGSRPASLLREADPSRERVVEFHSLSKMFNMTGWRVGFAAGHPEVIAALEQVKQNIDSGVFSAVQDVAAQALAPAGEDLLRDVMAVYPARRRLMTGALRAAGFEVFETEATFYVWARVPRGEDSFGFCRRALADASVVVTPGTGFGSGGEGWFRLSLTAPDERLAEAAERFRRL